MNTKHLKAAGAAVSLLIASGPALATSTGPQTLLEPATATDVFQFSCPAGTVNVKWIVSDTTVIVNHPAVIRMAMFLARSAIPFLVVEDNSPPLNSGGEGGLSSNNGTLLGGGAFRGGTFTAIVYKTAPGADSYEGNISCTRSDGVAVQPVLPAVPQQNQ